MWPFSTAPRECQGCQKLRREFAGLTLEFEELLDKVKRWMGRENARLKRDGAGPETDGTSVSGTDTESAGPVAVPRAPGLLRRRA